MSSTYPPPREEYVASQRHRASNLGAGLGMLLGAALMITSIIPVATTYIGLVTVPAVLFTASGLGMLAFGAAASGVSSLTYDRRYKKEFEAAQEIAEELEADPQLTAASRSHVPALARREGSHAEYLDARRLEESAPNSLRFS
jgi:hypothetical protein